MIRVSPLRGLLAVAAACAFGTSCDPCFATSSCGTSAPRLAIDGELVRAEDGRGVDGVRIDVLRRGGVTLAADSFSVETSGGGFWHVESPAQASGNVTLDFRVHAPELPAPYVVAGRSVHTVSRSGDAVQLERWVSRPYLNYYIDLFFRPTGKPLVSADLSFQRRSATWLTRQTTPDSVLVSQTDASVGRAKLFPGSVFFTDTGDAVGDLVVSMPSQYGPSVIRDLHLHPDYVYHDESTVLRYGAGPSLEYAIQLFSRATGQPMTGVPFTATRTGGIPVLANTVSGVTDASGYARLHFAAGAAGTLEASLTFTPVGQTITIPLTLPTFDSDVGRLLTNVTVGASLNYAVQVFDRATGKAAAGVAFTAVRTSGIRVASDTVTGTTDNDGYARPGFVPLGEGTLTANITFTPKVGVPATFQYSMATFDGDAGRLLGNVVVGSYMNYFGLLRQGFNVPFAGVPVRVHWTGGVPMAPADTTIITNADGVIPINSIPGAVGNGILELTFLPPPPYSHFIVRNITLPTMQQDVPAGQTVWVWDVLAPLSGPPGSEVAIVP